MRKVLLALFLASTSPLALGWSAALNPSNSKIIFHAIGHPSALRITGKGSGVTGTLSYSGGTGSGAIRVDLDSLDTGIGLRNEHMKTKYLQTQKYRYATLVLKPFRPEQSLDQENVDIQEQPFEGELEVHGVKKRVAGTAQISLHHQKLKIDASFKTKISDYGIPEPGYLGITVADEVDVTTHSEVAIQMKK